MPRPYKSVSMAVVHQALLASGLRDKQQIGDQHDQQGQSYESGVKEKAIEHAPRQVLSMFDSVIEYPSHTFLSAHIVLLRVTQG